MDSIVELIMKIKLRPGMYLGRNYISCLKAFLDGWHQRDYSNISDIEIMNKFQEKIEKSYKIKSSHSWCDILLFYSQDESKALDKFFKEFEEFLAEYEKKSE